MTDPLEDELIDREAQWRASLLEVTDYYEAALARREAEIAELQFRYADMVKDRDRYQEGLQHYERTFGALQRSGVWKLARRVTGRKD